MVCMQIPQCLTLKMRVLQATATCLCTCDATNVSGSKKKKRKKKNIQCQNLPEHHSAVPSHQPTLKKGYTGEGTLG